LQPPHLLEHARRQGLHVVPVQYLLPMRQPRALWQLPRQRLEQQEAEHCAQRVVAGLRLQRAVQGAWGIGTGNL
jgi:hypothetical protein